MAYRQNRGNEDRKRDADRLDPRLGTKQRSSSRQSNNRSDAKRLELGKIEDSTLSRRSSGKDSLAGSGRRRATDQDDEKRLNDLDYASQGGRDSRQRRGDGRKSPNFGRNNSDDLDDQRLETFGKRGEESMSKASDKSLGRIDLNLSKDEPRRHPKSSASIQGARPDARRGTDSRNRRDVGRPPTGADSRNKSRDPRSNDRRNNNRSDIGDRGGRETRGLDSRDDKSSKFSRRAGTASSYDDPRYEKHLSAKMNKRQPKAINYNEKKEKRDKDWMLDFKSHRPIVHYSDKFEQPSKETQSYLIILAGLNNIPVERIPILKEKSVTPTVNYCCTLYDEKHREFFGRSYTSRPVTLRPGFKATDEKSKDYIFMHTSNKEETISLVIEAYLEIVDLDKNGKTHYVSLGYSLFRIFGAKGVAVVTSIPMYSGSPRFLVCKAPFKDMMVNTSTMSVQIKEYNVLNPLKNLIPSTTICGMNDMIPGLMTNKMSLKREATILCATDDLVINRICMDTSRNFEDKFVRFLEDHLFEKYKTADELQPRATLLRIGKPRIAERKIYINYDNTWRMSDEKLFIALEAPKEDRYSAIGYVELKDFILDPSVSLVFKIEFQVEMPTLDRKKREKAFFTIAWGYFLPSFNSQGEIIPGGVDWDLKFGPGMTPDGSILWAPDQRDRSTFKLEFSADIIPKGKFDPNEINTKPRERAPDIRINRDHDDTFNLSLEHTKIEGDQSIPRIDSDRQSRDLKRRLDKERLENERKKREIENLNEKVRNVTEQLFDNKSTPQIELDSKNIRKDERRNLEIVKQKYEKELKRMKDQYDDKMRAMEDKYDDRGRRSSSRSPNRSRDERREQNRGPVSQLPYASSYLADPALYNPSFYPPDDRDRLIGKSRYIDDDLKILPPPPQIPLELPTTFDLSRDDEIAFVKLGIKEEILRNDSYDEPDLEVEMRNPLQASEFVIRFIAFKPPLSMPYGQSVPRRMYFRFNFFTFQESITEPCELKDPDARSNMVRELIPGQQYLLERVGKSKVSELRSVEAEFNIDKTVSKIYDENIQFYQYLLQRDVSIDVYDADSHLHYGTCCVNLRSMLKQNRSGVVRAKNCEIAAFESSNRSITGAVNMGHLQILISHQGKRESEVSNLDKENAHDSNNFFEERKQPSQKHKFNKKVKSKPIQGLNEEYVNNKPQDMYENIIEQPFNIEEEEGEEVRKKMRVERLKQYKLKQKVITDMEHKMKTAHLPAEIVNVLSDPSKPEWAKKQSLRQIETLRDYTKPYIIDQVLKDHIKSMKQLYVVPGSPSFFKYNLKNPFTSRTVFTINLVDPDKIYLGETKEFKLVNNHNFEWEFWHSKRKWEAPRYWDMINKRDEIMLEPGEECPLLFKFVSFREYDTHKSASELYIKERSIHIIFEYSSHREGKGQMFETKLVVSPKKPPIDFSMTFYEPPNSHASITIPASFYVDPHQAYCSDQNVICEFDAENRLNAELRTPDWEFNNPKSFLVYVYNDRFSSGLQCVLRIVIESVMCIYTKSRVGLRMEQTLAIEGDKPRKVLLYSSNNRIVETTGEPQTIIPNSHNILNVSVRTFEKDYKKVKINCVDANTRELVKSWLMLVESEEPKITRSIEIKLMIDKGITREIDFENKLNKEAIFEFASTRPDLCQPKQTHVRVGPKSTKRVEFFFPPKRVKGKGDCLIFINDEDFNFYESYRFRLSYVA